MPENSEDPSRLEVMINTVDPWSYYIALSYCWGDPEGQEMLYANGHPFLGQEKLV